MEKSGSFSQSAFNRKQSGAEVASPTDFNANLHQQAVADDSHYHADKLGLGSRGVHEGWIKAEEADAAAHAAVSAEARHEMIAIAAYYHAEARGFAPTGTSADWLQAEAEIDAMLLHGHV